MIEVTRSELFDYLGKNMKSLDFYRDIFNSIEPEKVHGNLFINSPQNGIWITLDRKLRVKYIILFAGNEKYDRYKQELPVDIAILNENLAI
jgi:hypothetical protein